jgi:hypothetical protein
MCPLYISGLIGTGDRKSVQPIAARLAPGEYDQLHHFIADGIWDPAPLESELLVHADTVDRFQDDADYRVAGLFERGQLLIMRGVVLAIGADTDEEAILAIQRHIAQRFAIDRDQALAVLPSGFRDQLLGPGTEIGNLF